MQKHSEQRVGIFVDTANMYHSAKNLFGSNVNFGEVLNVAVADRKLIRAIAYVIRSSADEESNFFDALGKQGFEVKQKELQIFSSGVKKADWDVGLAVDAIKLADRLDTIIIVSGDGDYIPLVTYLQESKGCLVEVAAFDETMSAKLKETVDDFINLSDNPEIFLINHKKNRNQKTSSRSATRSKKRTSNTETATTGGKKKRKVIF